MHYRQKNVQAIASEIDILTLECRGFMSPDESLLR